jgi:hypothetical protein
VLPWHVGALALRILGVLAVAGGVVTAAAIAAVTSGATSLLLAGSLGGTGVVLGALALRGALHAGRRARANEAADLELRMIALAESRGGVLTATEVARELGIATVQAENALTDLSDGTRVTGEVTEDGRIEYHFREVAALSRPRVRVAIDPSEEAGDDAIEGEREHERTRG